MVARLLLGRDDSGTYCFRTTKPGYDVLSNNPASNPNAFTFASDWDRIDRIHQSGVAQIKCAHVDGNSDGTQRQYDDPDWTGVDKPPAICGITFPSLGYVPMFTVTRRNGNAMELETINYGSDTDSSWASKFTPFISYGYPNVIRIQRNFNYNNTTMAQPDANGNGGEELTVEYTIWAMAAG